MGDKDQFQFTLEFQDLVLACLIRHPKEMLRFGPILKANQFIGVMPTITSDCALTYMQERGRFPAWPVLEELVLTKQNKLGDRPEEEAKVHDYLQQLQEADTGDIKYVTERVIKFARERAVLAAIKASILDVQAGEEMSGELVKRFEQALRVGQDLDDLGYILHQDAEAVVRKITHRDYGIRTGFHLLDTKVCKNGLSPGWLVTLLAPPKRYKTATCLNMALNMIGPSIGENVFYYTSEISQELALVRTLFNLAGLSQDAMYLDTEHFIEAAKTQINRLVAGNLLIKGYGAKTATIRDLEMHATTAIQQLGIKPKAIFIDFAETMAPADRKASEHEQSASIYTDARAMGHKLGCPVIMPDRCNRETVDLAVPNMKSFQGSFQKGGIIDLAIGLCATEAEYLNNILRMFVFLFRHGRAFQHFRGKVDPELMQIELTEEIEYVPDEEPASGGRGRRRGAGGGAAPNLPPELQAGN
jgi:replicative DNA helicase